MNKIHIKIKEKNADAFLLFNHEYSGQPGTRFFSKFSGSESVLLITKQKRLIITDGRYFSQVQNEVKNFELIKIINLFSFVLLKNLCLKLKIRTILIDSNCTFCSTVEKLKLFIPEIKIILEPGFIQEIRMIKEVNEIKLLQKAVDIAQKAFHKFLPLIKIGVTEQWLANKLESLMKECGSEKIAFGTIMASGKNSALPHAKPTNKKIKAGELITIDFGAYYQGYAWDIARTVGVKKISNKLNNIYNIVKEAQELGCQKAKAGITGAKLDSICRDYIFQKGFGKYFLHGTGHGLGMEVHELPYVSGGYTKTLPINSVITCEPGIYIKGLGGVRIEDDLVLTKNGNINLTRKISKELILVG